ncbi:hypothetical protein [Bradyrhizobium tropiciagri]|nr:hypothetical protein [Bradyrhizobium tropiciagri]
MDTADNADALTTRSQVVETESVSESVIDGHQKEQSASNQQNG